MAERIISFDILRGWAILGNLMVHTFMLVSQVEGVAETNPSELTTFGFILMGVVVVFGHWRGLFLMISAAVHMFTMQRKLKQGISRVVILVQEVIKGILLWLWAMFFYVFLAQWSISKGWVETGSVVIEWQDVYHADAFVNIAFAIILSAIVFYILTSNEKLKKPIVGAIVFAVIGCLFIFPAPTIHEAAINFWGVDLHDEFGHLYNIGDKGWWDYILRYIGNQSVGRESPLFPHYAYSAVGSILGIFISQEKPNKKKFLSWGYGLAGFCMVFSAFWLFIVEKIPEDPFSLVDFHIHPTWFVFVTIGMLLILILSFMAGLEFKNKINWDRRLRLSKFGRRAGFLSLSVYSFASIQALLRVALWGITQLFGWSYPGFRTSFGLSVGWTFLLILLEMGLWFFILWIWEKVYYVGSLEWLFALVLKTPFQRKQEVKKLIFGDFLNVRGRLIEPTPIHWITPETAIETTLIDDEIDTQFIQEEKAQPMN